MMTDRRSNLDVPTAELPSVPPSPPRRQPIRKPSPFAIIASSLALFLVITIVLAFQMRAGADPALGAVEPQQIAAATAGPRATAAPRKILIRRVIVTKIIEERPRVERVPAPVSAPPTSVPAAPATRVAAPAPAPAAAPAPAPARAPAPLTTKSS